MCVNSYREENVLLWCELMGLPGVRLQLEAALEMSGVDPAKVSHLLPPGAETQGSGLGPPGETHPVHRVWVCSRCPPEKCCSMSPSSSQMAACIL